MYTFLYAKMPPPLAFDIHDHFENDVKCMPPVLCIRRGRPKLQRHPKSFEEPRNSNQSHVCSGCQQGSHNVVTCRSAMTTSTEGGVTTMRAATSSKVKETRQHTTQTGDRVSGDNASPGTSSQRTRKPRLCRGCGQPGHDLRKCHKFPK